MFASKNSFLTAGSAAPAPPPAPYSINNSLRLRKSATPYMSRGFPVSSPGTAYTFSFWMKLGEIPANNGYYPNLLCYVQSAGAAYQAGIGFTNAATGQICWWEYNGSAGYSLRKISNQYFRDIGAWYHMVVIYDSTNATAEDRAQIWVNGVRITSWGTNINPSLNRVSYFASNSSSPYIPYFGAENRNNSSAISNFDGYFAEVHFIDGQALAPTSFGEFSSTTGSWIPVEYTGSYGSNGFYLDFSDTTSPATLGYDQSPNGNNWTVNGISTTAGETYDAMTDSPTDNYPVLNQLLGGADVYTYDGNLTSTNGNSIGTPTSTAMLPTSGKFYYEAIFTNNGANWGGIGLRQNNSTANSILYLNQTGDYSVYEQGGVFRIYQNGSTIATLGPTISGSQVWQVCVDVTNGKAWIGYDNTFYTSAGVRNVTNAQVATGTSPTLTFTAGTQFYLAVGTYYSTWQVTFGQRPFSYTPPTGYLAFKASNMPTPTITNGAEYFAATTYTGNSSTQAIVNTVNGVGFQPDFVWQRSRNAVGDVLIMNSINAYNYSTPYPTSYMGIYYAGAIAGQTWGGGPQTLTSYDSSGFTIQSDYSWNYTGHTYVAWQWKGGGGPSNRITNTDGSISADICVNATCGMSAVNWFGTNANATVGHGLGVAPAMIITYLALGYSYYPVYHVSTGPTKYLELSTTTAETIDSTYWNNTAPTSSVFSVGSAAQTNNVMTGGPPYYPIKMQAICFAQIAGFSSFGSYVGDGDINGPFVYCGFRPRWIMIKNTTTGTSGCGWFIYDTTRNPNNNSIPVTLNTTDFAVEAANAELDILSNGFKLRVNTVRVNWSGATFIYAAFAECPFQYANAR